MLPTTACGLLATAVLNINNLRDIESDRENGKNTLAVRLGRTRRAFTMPYCSAARCCVSRCLHCSISTARGAGCSCWRSRCWCATARVLRDPTPVGMRPMLEHMVKAALLANLLFAIGVALS